MVRLALLLSIIAIAALLLCACSGPGQVQFEEGQCLIDGHAATLSEVESRQAEVTRRILGRQPLFVLITVLVVALAGASHAEKLVFLFSTRGAEVRGLGERIRLSLDRFRAHPVRYFAIVTSTLALLVVAGGCYIYLDADKRASERALGLLQFCHLALRTAEEKGVLDEQRRNLQTIQATAGDIRSLVNKLPPEEQRKAQEIVDQMGTALARQGKLVGQHLQRSDEATQKLQEHTAAVERGLSSVETDMLALKSLPAGIRDLGEQGKQLDGALKSLDGKLAAHDAKLAASDAKLAASDAKLTALDAALKTLLGRPAPACVCECGHADKPAPAPEQPKQ